MSLLSDILESAVDANVDLPTLLRKCKLLAARVRNEDFAEWVDHELNGYPSEDDLPSYRILRVQSYGDFYGPFGSGLRSAPIPETSLRPEHRKYATTQFLTEGVSGLQAMAQSEQSDSNIQLTWHPNLVAVAGSEIYRDYTCLRAWTSFSSSVLVGILDLVRNRVLDFTIKLEAEIPDAANVESLASISQERSQQIFQTVILGDVGNLASGSSEFSQEVGFPAATGDLAGLKESLQRLHVSEEDIDDLEAALREDGEPDEQGNLGSRTSDWIGKMVAKALSGTWNVGASTAADVLKKAILAYLGLE